MSELKLLSYKLSITDTQAIVKNSFIAIFKDTLLQPSQASEMDICLDVFEIELRSMIAKDSLISLNSTNDTIWTFDTTISGRRLYGTVFSGPALTNILKESFSDNIIHLYSSAELHASRLLKGILIYISEEAGWKFRAKTE
jgi:hypothetical protein